MSAGELTDLAATAEPIDPRQPERRIDIPRTPRSFSFQLDKDLVKLVKLVPDGELLRIAVMYYTDSVLEQESATIPLHQTLAITADAMGLVVEWRQPLLASLGWPRIRRRRRF